MNRFAISTLIVLGLGFSLRPDYSVQPFQFQTDPRIKSKIMDSGTSTPASVMGKLENRNLLVREKISWKKNIVPIGFSELTSRVLLTTENKEKLDRILADEEIHSKALRLLSTLPNSEDPEELKSRLETIEYIARALEWSNNPNRNSLVQKIKSEVTEVSARIQVEFHGSPESIRKMLVADQVELLGHLYSSSPEAFAEYREHQEPGSWLGRVTRYAENVRKQNGGHL